MPTYEMPVLIRLMKKPDTISTLKRLANAIFQTGGFIRTIENWGQKELPCKTSIHGHVHREANYFLFSFDVPPSSLRDLVNEYNRDIDVVRVNIFKENKIVGNECTLAEEMLPPPYRPSVLAMLNASKKRSDVKRKFKYNNGLDYYPFKK